MNRPFDIPVLYKHRKLAFPARLLLLVYSHRFVVDVYGQKIFFKPDKERAYSAIIGPEIGEDANIDAELLSAIAAAIEVMLK